MSYTGAAEMDIPMGGYRQTPLIADLMAEVTSQSAGEDQMTDIDAKILDEAPDHSDDDRDAVVPGSDGYLGQRVFNVGKYQKNGQLMTFKVAYETDKKYVAWVRKSIKGRTVAPDKTDHPTMTQLRLYIAIRDAAHHDEPGRGPGNESFERATTSGHGCSSKDQDSGKGSTKIEGNVRSSRQCGGARCQSSTSFRCCVGRAVDCTQDPETEETPQERRRRQLRQRIQELTNQLEELDENAEW